MATFVIFLEADIQKYFCIDSKLCNVTGFSSMIVAMILDFIAVITMFVLLIYAVKKHERICDVYRLENICNVLGHTCMNVIWLLLLIPFGLTIDALVKSPYVPMKIMIIYEMQIVLFGIVLVTTICAYVFKHNKYYSDDPEAISLNV